MQPAGVAVASMQSVTESNSSSVSSRMSAATSSARPVRVKRLPWFR